MTAMAMRMRPARRWVVESPIAGPLITLVFVFVLFALFVPNFFTMRSISGIVNAATSNGISISGVAGGFDGPGVCAMALKIGEANPVGTLVDDAILYAVDNGARVITMSLVVAESQALNDAIVDAYLTADPEARVAAETLCTTNRIVIAGEVRGPDSITRAMLEELSGRGALAEQYIQLLIAEELQPNSKWIIGGGEMNPVIELRETQ